MNAHNEQQPAAAQEAVAVAYLDIGAGGYLDLGSDLPEEQLLALPKGRHALGIIGTYGIDGYVAAPVAAAPGIDLTVPDYIKQAHDKCKLWPESNWPGFEPDAGFIALLEIRNWVETLIDASPKGALNEQFGSAEGLDSPKGGSDEAAPAAITRMLPEVPESCERPEIGPHPFTGFDVGPFFVHLDIADNEAMTVSGTDDVGAWVVTHRESGFAVQKGIPTHWRAIWLAQQLLAKSSWSGATKGAVLATLVLSVVDEIRVLRADAMHGDCQGQIDTRWAFSAKAQAGDAEVQP